MNKPLIETPSANALLTAGQDMTPEYAQQLLQTWLASKADAFGEAHQSDKLAEILDGSLLKTWQKRANDLSKIDVFWRYQHSLEANSLKVVSSSPNQAKIEAIIREKATYFQNGKEIPDRSYDDTLRVRYGLVRQGDRWLIQSIQVLQSL